MVFRPPGRAAHSLSRHFTTEDPAGCVKLFVDQDPEFHSESLNILETVTDENFASPSIGSHETPAECSCQQVAPVRRIQSSDKKSITRTLGGKLGQGS